MTETTPRRKREKRVVETSDYMAFARRILRATSRRVADRDIEALTGLKQLREEIDLAMVDAVAGLVDTYSWAEIGRTLGVTKQAAFMRYSGPVKERKEALARLAAATEPAAE